MSDATTKPGLPLPATWETLELAARMCGVRLEDGPEEDDEDDDDE